MNKVILTGFVGKDAEVKNSIANFTLATTETYKNKAGERETETEWHNIKCFGKLAEFAEKWIKKGEVFTIEGKIKTEKWEDQSGTKKEFRCIYASAIVFVPAKKAKPEVVHEQKQADIDFEVSDDQSDDLPF